MILRLLDYLGGSLLLIILFPVLILIALLVLIFLGRPVIFRQQRPGRNARIFTLFKFRTMRRGDPTRQSDAARLTRFGRLLRKSSLDELPELLNVLRGEMSLVGPRPLLVEYLPLYSERQRRRHEVLPGITGWAQIKGRNALSWEEKLEYDVWYVENRSVSLYLRILVLTIKVMLRPGTVSAAGHATMPPFTGSPR